MKLKLALIGMMIAALFGATAVQAQKQEDVERQLKAAMNKELVDRDPKAAIELYKKVAASGIRPFAAQALMHMADSYRKLGDAEAQKIYERIVKEYGDQKEIAAQAQAQLKGAASSTDGSFKPARLTQVQDYGGWAAVTPDGRYLLSGWGAGIYDLKTGKNAEEQTAPVNTVSLKEIWGDGDPNSILLSPDGKTVAYTLELDKAPLVEIRLRPFSPAKRLEPRVLVQGEEYTFRSELFGWSPDGRDIFAIVTRKDETHQIVRVSVADGSVRTIKSLEWRWPNKLSLSPDGRYIAYDAPVARDSKDRNILVLATDGSSETTIDTNPARDASPVWTPDGKAIVFTSDRSGTFGLWTVQIADGKPAGTAPIIPVRQNIEPLYPLGFTRDGTFYYERNNPGLTDLYTADIDMASGTVSGSRAMERSPGRSFGAAYSPDRTHVAYFSRRGSLFLPNGDGSVGGFITLIIRSLESGQEREIPVMATALSTVWAEATFGQPVWFPDGQSVVFVSRNDDSEPYITGSLHRIDVRTGEDLIKRRIEATGKPAVSPDGQRIFYQGTDDGTATILMAYDVGTQREFELFRLPASNAVTKYLRDLLLSPDGQQFAFARRSPRPIGNNGINTSATLSLVSVSGSPKEVKAPEPVAHIVAWSADGKKLLVQTGAVPRSQFGPFVEGLHLWWVPTDGSAAQRIAGTYEYAIDSARPDGNQIAYTVRIAATSESEGVWADPDLRWDRDARTPTVVLTSAPTSAVFVAEIASDGRALGPITSVMQSGEFSYWGPLWSPDGQTLQARRTRGPADEGLHEWGRGGHSAAEDLVLSIKDGPEKLYGTIAPRPNPWFHDGRRILDVGCLRSDFHCLDVRNLNTAVVNPAGGVGEKTPIVTLDFLVAPELSALSLDDKTLYVVPRPLQPNEKNNRLAVVDISTGKEKQRLKLPLTDEINEIALSPDARTFAMWTVLDPKTGQSRLFRIDVDGTGYRELYRGRAQSLAWTPDGQNLFFAKSDNGEDWQVMRIPAAGGKEQFTGLRVKGLQYISLNPDGRRLAFDGSAPNISPSSTR